MLDSIALIIQTVFSAALALVAMNAFTANTLVFILPVTASAFFVLKYCAFCAARRPKLYYSAGAFAVLLTVTVIMLATDYDITFELWLYANISESIGYSANSVIVFIVFCFFIPSGVYYFTSVLYRPIFLLLIIFISYLLNDQRTVDVPPVYMALTIASYFAVLIIFGGIASRRQVVYMFKKRYVVSFAAGILLCAGVSVSLLDFEENRAGWTQNLRGGLYGISGLLGYSNTSGISEQSSISERILFLAEAEEPIYFVRQTFGQYYNNKWHYLSDSPLSYGSIYWKEEARARNMDEFLFCVKEAYDAGFLSAHKQAADLAAAKLYDVETVKTVTIIPQGVSTSYVLAPARAFDIDGANIARNRLGEIFFMNSRMNSQYTINYYSETFRREPYLIDFAASFDAASFYDLLYSMEGYYKSAQQFIPASLTSAKADLVDASAFFFSAGNTLDPVFQSQRLIDLVEEITRDKESDYVKALAIELYFLTGDYTYDVNYNREINDDIELFIFDAKSGMCGHYATAMTIMARMAGLNARYAEGFISFEQNRSGQYVIRAKNAHAFVQVYINGYGWVTFDPTVSGGATGQGGAYGEFFGVLVNYVQLIFAFASAIILICVTAYLLYTRVITEILFIRRAAVCDTADSIKMIYNRILKIARRKLNLTYHIPAGLCASFIYENTGVDISAVTDCYNEVMFSGASFNVISPERRKAALKAYIALRRREFKCIQR